MKEKVQFTPDNIGGCICMQCPVQIRSQCAKEKAKAMKGKESPESQAVPKVYCSSGKATCKDIDTKQMCICGACPVWHKHKLVSSKPPLHFCRDGAPR